MREKSSLPIKKSNTNLFLNSPIILLLFFLPFIKKIRFNLEAIKKTVNNIDINKIQNMANILIKTGPYLPESVIEVLNSIIPTYYKVNKVVNLINVMNSNKLHTEIIPITNMSKSQKMDHIISLIEKDFHNTNLKKYKPFLTIAANIENYTPLIDMVSSFIDPSKKTEIKTDDIINMITPILGKENGDNVNKIKEMIQMIDLLNELNSSDE